MLGGNKYPGAVEENRAVCDNTRLAELQLIGHVPIRSGGAIGIGKPTDSRPLKRIREEEPVNMQKKLDVSLNNVYQDELGHIGASLNLNPLATGLGFFVDKKERWPSVNSTCENMKNTLPSVSSISTAVKMEIDRQTEELCQYIKHQEEIILKGGKELNQRHTVSLFNALEKSVHRKMYEKELQIDNISRKNKELEDRIKQVTIEAQSWHSKAKYNESVAHVLKSNIHQLMAQGPAQGREGFGDNEVDDAVSCMNCPETVGDREFENQRLKCRSCRRKQVSVLLFPCRHLCLCEDCEGLVEVCPVCQVIKTASFLVYM
ncbi:hypothetical protein OROMI_007862 [Orobanche minor]